MSIFAIIIPKSPPREGPTPLDLDLRHKRRLLEALLLVAPLLAAVLTKTVRWTKNKTMTFHKVVTEGYKLKMK